MASPTEPGKAGPGGRCPYCGRAVKGDEGDRGPAYPFCSLRCRMADLGRWFNEDYRVPGAPADQAEQPGEDA